MKRNLSTGSAHVVIIIILMLGLLTALGWIFYQNFVYKDPQDKVGKSTDLTTQEKPAEQKISEKTSCMHYEKVCITHPDDWTYRASHEKLDMQDDVTILKDYDRLTSADADIDITLSNGIGQIGGTCLPEDNKAEGLVVEAAKTGLTVRTYEGADKKVYVLRMVVPIDGMFTPIVTLSADSDLQKVGKHGACDFMYYGILEGRANKNGYGLMQVSTEPFDSSQSPTMTFEAAKRTLEEASYKEAFSILGSVHYKK